MNPRLLLCCAVFVGALNAGCGKKDKALEETVISLRDQAQAAKIAAGDVLSPEGRQREVELSRKASEAAKEASDAAKAAGEAAKTAAEASKQAADTAIEVVKAAKASQTAAQAASDQKGAGSTK
jgi:hypothetical protein